MLFNSIDFWLFFLVVCVVNFMLPHRWRWILLLVASYAFYMNWNASYIILIIISTVIDYLCARGLKRSDDPKHRKRLLLTSLAMNLGFLFTFKYWGWFHETMGALFGLIDLKYAVPKLEVLLPVGISFYTFQTLSYTIDVYKGTLEPEEHFGRFALYVSFFPQLVAGPIERASTLLPQLRQEHALAIARIQSGLQLAAWGMFKKIVIADRLSVYVDQVYNNTPVHNGTTFVLATYAFALQIYCDFSGYSDIAIGVARVLGYDLMKNFERPYFSTSIKDFWRRWHISLSSWLRDYLYISLGGNRGSQWFIYRNLMLTMLLGGLWHGAHWNFVIWGGLQGLMLSISRMTLERRDAFWARVGMPSFLRDAVRIVITFHLVCLSWIFFRATTFGDAVNVLKGIGTTLGQAPFIDIVTFAHAGLGIIVLVLVELYQQRRGSVRAALASKPWPLVWALWYALIFFVILFGVEADAQFIYFQF